MTSTATHHAIHEAFRPVGWEISLFAPLHDWRHIYRKGWGDAMKRNVYARSIVTVLFRTREVGMCGRAQTPAQRYWATDS